MKRATDPAIIDRVLLAGFLAMFPIGATALLLAGLWYPLIYLFWGAWPPATLWLVTRTRIP